MAKLRFPHPEFARMVDAIKCDVIRREEIILTDRLIPFAVFRSETPSPDLAFYDEDGMIYIPEDLLQFNEKYAHLAALHEHVEVQHKRAERTHAYAHRRALLIEFLTAKQVFTEAHQLKDYLQWRIGLYPEEKNLDQAAIVAELMQLLASNRPRRGVLFQLITDYML